MKFVETLRALPPARQIMLGLATIGVIAAMSFMVRGAMKEPMALLYSGLEAERAGEIIAALDQGKIAYEIQQEAIFVPKSMRDKVRFELAQQGLPKQAVQGYELLDDVNGFSVTSEMYNASYWRAKEGELTRTILAIPGVDAARVHIGASLRSGFARSQPQQTASVTLSATRDLSAGQAEAIQYLVALAVSGLNPADVAVIDPRYGIIAGPKADKMQQPSLEAESQEALLEAKILRLLEARLGAGNAQVTVSVDVSRERQVISAVEYDPDSRVVRQRTTNDTSGTSAAGGGGELTIASNLPQTEDGAGSGTTNSNKASTESIAYEINETRMEREILPGEIKRISIAVLLNQQALDIDPAAADAETQLTNVVTEFEKLISSGAGLKADRGDAITVELMPFQEISADDLVAAPTMIETMVERYLWSGIQALLLGIVVLVLGFGVIRPIFTGKGEVIAAGAADGLAAAAAPSVDERATDPLDYLKEYARERQDDTAALLQQWLDEDRKVAVNE